MKSRPLTWAWLRDWCVAWWHSGREDDDADVEDTPSDMGYATPVSVETPLPSSLSRGTSLNVIRDPYVPPTTPHSHHLHCLPQTARLQARSLSNDSVRFFTTCRFSISVENKQIGCLANPTINLVILNTTKVLRLWFT